MTGGRPKKEQAYFVNEEVAKNFAKYVLSLQELIGEPVITNDVEWGK